MISAYALKFIHHRLLASSIISSCIVVLQRWKPVTAFSTLRRRHESQIPPITGLNPPAHHKNGLSISICIPVGLSYLEDKSIFRVKIMNSAGIPVRTALILIIDPGEREWDSGIFASIVMGLVIRKHDGIIESDTGRIGVGGFKFQYSWQLSISSFLKTIKNTLERRWYDRDTPCK